MKRFHTLASLAGAVTVTVAFTGAPALADITGFNSGAGYTANVSAGGTAPTFTADGVTLTQSGVENTAGSVFFNTPQAIDGPGFTAQFTYQQTATANPSSTPGDGVTFTIQNSDPTALGSEGGSLGYGNLAGNSFAVALDLNQGFPRRGTSGLAVNGSYNDNNGVPVAPVLLEGGNPVLVTLAYDAASGDLVETLLDLTTADVFTTTFTGVDVSGILGSPTAFVGFTGGTGQASNTQVISDFTFTVVPEPSSLVALGLGGLALLRRRR